MNLTTLEGLRYWQEQSQRYRDKALAPNSFYRKRAKHTAEFIASLDYGTSVLDVGCGTGFLSLELAKKGFEVYGTDISRAMLHTTIELTKEIISEGAFRFRLSQGSIPPFVQKFDLIAVIGVFPYVTNYSKYLNFLCTQLKPKGIIIASCVNRFALYNQFQKLTHYLKYRKSTQWKLILNNLHYTGLKSGGFVKREDATQIYDPNHFDDLFRSQKFEYLDSLDFYNISILSLDKNPPFRTNFSRRFARRWGWTHLGAYRRLV